MENANPSLITIITVVYNSALPLEITIQSVLSLQYPNIKYIVIDGGSTDETVNVIAKYKSRLYYCISEPDKGIYDAMNKGWNKAPDNSYILFLGAGDYLINLPDMGTHKQDDIIYGCVSIGNKYTFNTVVDFRMKFINAAHHQALLISKKIHPSPPFSLKYPVFADFDFNQRLYKKGYKFIKDDNLLAYAMSGGVSSPYNYKEMLKVVKGNFGFTYSLIARLYYFIQHIKNFFTGFSPA